MNIDKAFRNFVNVAVECGLTDAASLVEKAMSYGENRREFIDEVIGWAFADRHHETGRERHAAVVAAAEEFRKAEVEMVDDKVAEKIDQDTEAARSF